MTFAISIHALREEGDPPEERLRLVQFSISIHALREEGDGKRSRAGAARRNFYPRPPRGGRLQQARKRREAEEFLSTPSARRATSTLANIYSTIKDFYPRPPRGGRLANPDRGASTTLFLSTPSARRATGLVGRLDDVHAISIHALREEGDLANIGEQAILNKISIHALREEGDLQDILLGGRRRGFLSTPSARRATWVRRRPGEKVQNFYPRPPRGGRPAAAVNTCTIRIFLSTPSARRATFPVFLRSELMSKFLSTPSARRATSIPGLVDHH